MKTKSPLIRTLWSVGYAIVAVIGLRIATAEPSRVQDSPQRDRTVVRKSWSVEPVKVVAAKNKKKEKIEIGKSFDDDDDWLDGFTVTVVNNYDKTVTAVSVDMVFRRDPGDSRLPLLWSLNFGPHPSSLEYLQRDPNKIIRVGETADLQLSPENYKWLTVFLRQNSFPVSVRRVELVIREVGFEDGSVLQSGTFFRQDPNNPNDPTKKIPVSRPTPSRNPRIRDQSSLRSKLSHHSMVKTSVALRGVQDEQCFTQLPRSFRQCSINAACGVYWDQLSYDPGYFTTEYGNRACLISQSVPCTVPCGPGGSQTCLVEDAVDVAV